MERNELEGMTKDELIAHAEDLGIEVHHSWVKDDIIKHIIKGQKAAAKHNEKHDDKFDSTQHHEDRKANIEAESKATAENQLIANFHGPIKEGETRDQLLERIRKMRESPPKEKPPEPFRSEATQKEFDREQEAGKAAVAKAKEAVDRSHQALREHAAGEKNQVR